MFIANVNAGTAALSELCRKRRAWVVMTDGQGNRRKPHFRQGEIEAQAIEALERARLLPPGDKRHELLKAAGKLRMQVVVERLSGETLAVSPKPTPRPANRRRNKT